MAITLPAGFQDMLPDDAEFYRQFVALAHDIFSRYGYRSIITPHLEVQDLFVRGIGQSSDVVSKEMFSALSGENMQKLLAREEIRSKSKLALRPEGTAGVVRAVVEHNLVPPQSAGVKLMYAGSMFRAERPQKGRLREFNQIGVECIGPSSPSIDAEGICMLMRFFSALGIPETSMKLFLNSLGCDECRPAYRQQLLSYMNEHIHELCDECQHRLRLNPLRAFDCKNEHCAAVMRNAPRLSDALCSACETHHKTVQTLLDSAGISYELDTSLVRGLDYYTRTVFEIQATDSNSAQNALGGGGRYDKLVEEVGGHPTPGFGFALGYERCKLALEAAGVAPCVQPSCQVFFALADSCLFNDAFTMCEQLRFKGFACEFAHDTKSLKSQLKLANKLAARVVIVYGENEFARGEVLVKDMLQHEEHCVAHNASALASYLSALF